MNIFEAAWRCRGDAASSSFVCPFVLPASSNLTSACPSVTFSQAPCFRNLENCLSQPERRLVNNIQEVVKP